METDYRKNQQGFSHSRSAAQKHGSNTIGPRSWLRLIVTEFGPEHQKVLNIERGKKTREQGDRGYKCERETRLTGIVGCF